MIKNYFHRSNLSFKDKFFSLDFSLILLVLSLGIISIFAIYSTERGNFGYYTQSHIYRFFIFFLIFLLLGFFNIKVWFKLSYIFYIFVIILLLGVHFFGIASSGSTRWISLYIINLQPSELMKVGLILFLARYYYKIPMSEISKIRYMIIPLLALFIPVALVVIQPDLGTALLLAATGMFLIWLAGLRIKYFMFSFVTLICSLPVVIAFLKPYQKLRILTFLNPEKDPLGAGYQIIQSKIAVGSGGFFGKGFLQGSQSYLDYLPEKHTDFIFTIFSEEFGFIGSLLLLLIYLLIIYRVVSTGNQCKNNFSKLYCYAFASAFFAYVTVNMSMVLGLLPIVGAPLPIMSYGGSSMLSMMIGLGIVMSCKIYQEETEVN